MIAFPNENDNHQQCAKKNERIYLIAKQFISFRKQNIQVGICREEENVKISIFDVEHEECKITTRAL